MKPKLLIMFFLCYPCQGGWPCGDNWVEYGSGKLCDCSGDEITQDDWGRRRKGCCPPPGRGNCEVTTEGNVRCNNSHVCYFPYMCGDTRLGYDKTCHCSADVFSDVDYVNNKGCCPPPGQGHCEVTDGGNVKCHNSTVYHRETQPCNDKCSDPRYTLCPKETVTQGSGHPQCYHTDYNNDRTYNCVNRADEKQIRLEDTGEDYSSVVPCDNPTDWRGDPVGGPGLMCGDRCYPTYKWCKYTVSCGSFTTTDANLCQNYTLWNNVNCTWYNRGRVVSYGRRCTGRIMRCQYPAYMRSTYINGACDDKSDQIYRIGQNCTVDHHLDTYARLFSNDDTNTEAKRGEYCTVVKYMHDDHISAYQLFRQRCTAPSHQLHHILPIISPFCVRNAYSLITA